MVINEAMTSNGNVAADDDGDFKDWIELFNPTGELISLAAYSLSDSASRPRMWVMPEVMLDPGRHLIVWASGKKYWYQPDRRPDESIALGFVSAGTLDGDHVELLVNGENVAGGETGLHLAVLDAGGDLVESQVFGTHQTTAESDRLVDVLRAVPPGQIVMMAIKGDGSAFLTPAAMTVLIDMFGSEYAHRLDPDDSWGLIAVAGGNPLVEDYRAFENGQVAGDTRSSTELHTSFRLRQTGDFLGVCPSNSNDPRDLSALAV